MQKGIIKRFSTLAAFDDYVKAVVVPQLPDDAQKLLWAQRPAGGRCRQMEKRGSWQVDVD